MTGDFPRRIGRLVVILALVSGVCSAQTFTGAGFSFDLPRGWYGGKLDQEKLEYAFCPVPQSPSDGRLSVQSFPARNRTLRGLVMQARHAVYMELDGYVLEEKALKLNGAPAVELRYRVGGSLKDEIFCRVMSLHNDRLYIIQTVFPAEDESQALSKILRTFRWGDEKETIGYHEY